MVPGLLLTGMLTAAVAGGQAAQERRSVAVQSMGVAENLYLVSGGGGHTAMLVTDDHGVVLVDTKNPGWGPAILDAVRAVTDEPITTIVNTHAHGDHTGSNPHFSDAVRIAAHENAGTAMARSEVFAGDNARFLPNETYRDTLSLFEGRDRIDLYHFGPAHTDGDTIVVFPALATAHVGDLFPRKAAPFIDRANGGSGVAYPDTLASALAGIADVDRVMPGPAPPPPGQSRARLDDLGRLPRVRGVHARSARRRRGPRSRPAAAWTRRSPASICSRATPTTIWRARTAPCRPSTTSCASDDEAVGGAATRRLAGQESAPYNRADSARRARRASAGAARGYGVPASGRRGFGAQPRLMEAAHGAPRREPRGAMGSPQADAGGSGRSPV